jgi:hypothetical protein
MNYISLLLFGIGFIFLGIYIRKKGEIDPKTKGNIFITSGSVIAVVDVLAGIRTMTKLYLKRFGGNKSFI